MRLHRLALALAALTVVALVAVLVFNVGSGGTVATQSLPTQPTVQAAQAVEDGRNVAVQIHGSWTIEVRDASGTTVSRTQFENALQPSGAFVLAKILSRTWSAGLWHVYLQGSPGPCLFGTAGQSCFVTEASDGRTQGYVFKTLTASAPTTGTNANKLVLSGTATAQEDSDISSVATEQEPCRAAEAPSTPCPLGDVTDQHIFSYAGLPSAVQVVTGQQIIVTVVFTFQ